MSQRTFSIRPVPPFRLDLTVWALRRRPENTVDRWDGSTYRRVLMIEEKAIQLEVRQSSGHDNPQLEVDLIGSRLSQQQEKSARLSLERMLGVHEDLRPFYRLAARDRRLQPLVEEFRGLKPPRFPTMFEAVANGIACQQLSLLVGILLLSRLAHENRGRLCVLKRCAARVPRSNRFLKRDYRFLEVSWVQRQQIASLAGSELHDS